MREELSQKTNTRKHTENNNSGANTKTNHKDFERFRFNLWGQLLNEMVICHNVVGGNRQS